MRCRDQCPEYRAEHPAKVLPSRLFFVRLWLEQVEDGVELRGNVRDAATGAFRAFRDWTELTEFLTDCAPQHANAAGTTGRRTPE